jgi:hypothetical protein
MNSRKGDERYFKDRADIVAILQTAKELDLNWVKEQLVIHDGIDGERVKEWDELSKKYKYSG